MPDVSTLLKNPTTSSAMADTPTAVSVEITARCQLRCAHCFNDSGPKSHSELDLSTMIRILDQIADWPGVDSIRLSGGEPTVHPSFRDIVDACGQRGIAVVINTNGIYSHTQMEYLKEAPIDLFMVSLDGLEKNNDAIRGIGSFQRAKGSCVQLLEAGQRVLVCCHLTKSSMSDLDGIIDLAIDLGTDLKLSPVRPIGRAQAMLNREILEPADYLSIIQTVSNRRKECPIRIVADFDILDAPVLAGGDDRMSCGAGRTTVNVNYDGHIYPCAFFVTPGREFSAGSVYDISLIDAWRTPAFEAFRVHAKCSQCLACKFYRGACLGGCPATAFFSTGFLDSRDPMCFAHLLTSGEPS
ncbi:MAG: radical SAM protein [Propionibacteriaceae bacterium]|jgi:radical SAM protein with 4Fe4S-binding SPASM domain|nr:radical SAM protein [Propionibacteriaceae bacterium]